MNRTISELRKTFGTKISVLENLLHHAEEEDCQTDERKEYASQVAVILRSLFCKDRSGIPLIESAQLEDYFLFPLHSLCEPYNELKETQLVGYSFMGDRFYFSACSLSEDEVPRAFLSFYWWINEVVIDFKMKGFPPLSRAEVIKTVADRNGAHVDVEIDKYTECLKRNGSMFITVVDNGKERDVDCSNLLTETVISIGYELLYSYRFLRKPELSSPSLSQRVFIVFDYSSDKWKRYKYAISPAMVNDYNTNHSYNCVITRFPISTLRLEYRKRLFTVFVARVEDMIDKLARGAVVVAE